VDQMGPLIGGGGFSLWDLRQRWNYLGAWTWKCVILGDILSTQTRQTGASGRPT